MVTRIIAVLVVKDNKILLSKRLKKSFIGKWQLPGGTCEEDENWKECAKRECLEETGWDVDSIYNLGEMNFPEHGFTVTYIYAEALEFKCEPSQEEKDKNTPWEWFALNEMPEPLMEGEYFAIKEYKKFVALPENSKTIKLLIQNYNLLIENLRIQIKEYQGIMISKDEIIQNQSEIIKILREANNA